VNPTSVPELAEMGYIDVQVADFGLAKAKLMSSTATKQKKDIGTTPYRAPELYTHVSHKNCINDDLEVQE
jgi:serine/threonine protein kinase